MKTATGADMNMLSMTKIGVPTVIGYIVMYCMTFPTGQEIVQTFCSAKDGKSAKIGSVLTGILSAVYAIVPAMIGLMAYTCIDGYAVSQQKMHWLMQRCSLHRLLLLALSSLLLSQLQ